MEITAAIFDFDGTLFDSMYVWKNVTKRYLESIGVDAKGVDENRLKSLSLLQASIWVKDEFNLPFSTDEIMKGFNNIVKKEYEFSVQPKKGVKDFLKSLDRLGVKMAIASVSEYEHIHLALTRCDMTSYFSEIFSCSSTPHGKNRPDVFNSALLHLQSKDSKINKSTTFVFEDALYALKVAKNDGFKTVGVYDISEKDSRQMKALSDFYIEDFTHRADFLKFVGAIK